MSAWIDTHSHFASDEFQEEFDAYMQRCAAANVGRIMVICMNRQEWQRMIPRLTPYPCIDLAVGYHPEDLRELTAADWTWLEEIVTDPRVKAIGEIGLDYHWDTSYNDLQKEAFIRQIELADRVNKPILVHSRDAAQDTFDLLKAHTPQAKGVMHCYGGSLEMAREYVKLGFYLSFGGPLTFKNAVRPKEVVSAIDPSFLLIETDCPYMAPHPMRGKQNESSYVHYVGEYMAQLKQMESEALQKQLEANYKRLLQEAT